MKNASGWLPTKFVFNKGRLTGSRNPRDVGVASRLAADLIAECYGTHLKDHCGGRLLDLGCGNVPLFEAYRNLVTENVCVDWEQSLHQNKHLDYECDLSLRLPFKDRSFDTIILSDVLEHIAAPEDLWHEMFRVLVPDGKLIMNAPFYYWLHETPHDYYRYTKYALMRFSETSGFTVCLLVPIGGAPEIVVDIFAKNLVRLGRTGRYMAMALQFACKKFIRTAIGKKISTRTAESFPFGYFMVAQRRPDNDFSVKLKLQEKEKFLADNPLGTPK
jgi:SAM-dependent methyltransferase